MVQVYLITEMSFEMHHGGWYVVILYDNDMPVASHGHALFGPILWACGYIAIAMMMVALVSLYVNTTMQIIAWNSIFISDDNNKMLKPATVIVFA